MRCFYLLLIIWLLPLFLIAQKNLSVKYISARNVYISGGRAVNVTVGDQFAVLQDEKEIAWIEVVYAALHSATCKILESSAAVKPGDQLKLISKTRSYDSANLSATPPATAAPEFSHSNQRQPRKSHSTGKSARISGYASLQYYHIRDLSDAGLDFSQPAFRFKLKARQLWGKDYNLNISLRSRYNLRSERYGDDVPEREWRNRVYRISFSYDNPAAPVNFRIGRIISNVFSGIGYIDGAQVQYNFNTLFSAGVFGGFQPEYRSSGFQTGIRKYGGFLRYQKGEYGGKRLESVLAMTGEYHGADVSREYIGLLNQYRHNSLWSIYQTLELDVNRGWRKERSGETLSLTGLYISGNIYPASWLSVGLSYDNRKNYYTWEMRNRADSLFLANFRQGLRGNVQVKIDRHLRLSATCGMRHSETDNGHAFFYSFAFAESDLLQRRIYCSFRYAGFDNVWTSGGNPSLRISKTFPAGLNAGMGYGAYIYKMKANGEKRLTHWIILDSRINLPARFYFSGSYQYDWGDDIRGHRLLAECGYRF